MIVTAGATNRSVYFYIVQDASATSPGEPATSLAFGNLTSASYMRQGAARVSVTPITLASASAAHADGGFILVDDTNMPGVYRFDVPDAAFATGVDQITVSIVVSGGSNAVAAPIYVDISDIDLRDSVRGGMTAMPNAAADAAGGLPISDAGGLDLDTLLDVAISTRMATSHIDATAGVVDQVTLTNTVTTNTDLVSAADVTTAVFAHIVENSLTADEVLRIMLSALAGKVAVSGSTNTFRDTADSTDRITSTVDSSGQRTAVTLDGS